jgi:hypothetical protein
MVAVWCSAHPTKTRRPVPVNDILSRFFLTGVVSLIFHPPYHATLEHEAPTSPRSGRRRRRRRSACRRRGHAGAIGAVGQPDGRACVIFEEEKRAAQAVIGTTPLEFSFLVECMILWRSDISISPSGDVPFEPIPDGRSHSCRQGAQTERSTSFLREKCRDSAHPVMPEMCRSLTLTVHEGKARTACSTKEWNGPRPRSRPSCWLRWISDPEGNLLEYYPPFPQSEVRQTPTNAVPPRQFQDFWP